MVLGNAQVVPKRMELIRELVPSWLPSAYSSTWLAMARAMSDTARKVPRSLDCNCKF